MRNTGFTIIESLVAISILVLAIVGATSAIQTGISSYIYSKDQIIAFYLAQEGVEQVRNMRDQNGLSGSHWLAGISQNSSDPCYFGDGVTSQKACIADTVTNTISSCSSGPGSCPVLRQEPSTGFYGYGGWPATVFRREIVLKSINANEISILVTVNWSKGPIQRQFRVRENILNWQ